jgi:hypothetical protein
MVLKNRAPERGCRRVAHNMFKREMATEKCSLFRGLEMRSGKPSRISQSLVKHTV